MKGRNKMRIISYHVRFTRFVITSTVKETTLESDETTFDSDEARRDGVIV